jgi:hypothetical protein
MADTVKYVYIMPKGDGFIHHTNLDAMKQMDGVTWDETLGLKVTDEAFSKAGGLIRRETDGKIFIGKTDAELAAEAASETRQKRIKELKQMLADSDYVVIKIAEGSATKEKYAKEITDRQSWRQEADTLIAEENAATPST